MAHPIDMRIRWAVGLALASCTPAPPELGKSDDRAVIPKWDAYIARESAVEGCVHETFGAALALYQLGTTGDREMRALLAEIAPDQRAHAVLAHDVAEFLAAGLGGDERRAVDAARRDAIRAVVRSADSAPTRALVEALFGQSGSPS